MESRCIHCDDLLPEKGDCTRCVDGGRAPEVLPAFLGLELQLDRRRRDALNVEPPPAIAPLPTPPAMRPRRAGTGRALTLEALAPPLPVKVPGGMSVARRTADRDEVFLREALLGGEVTGGGEVAAVNDEASRPGQTLRMYPEQTGVEPGTIAEATASRGLAGLAEALRMEALAERLGIQLQPTPERSGTGDPANASDAPRPAELWRRALAWAVDGALVLVVGAFYLGLAHWVTGGVSLQGLLLPALGLYVLVGAVYATVGSLMGGRTLGLRLAGIRLVDDRGRTPAPTVTLARSLLGAVSAALLGLGFWVALVDRRGQTLHDKLTSTFIVQAI